MPAKSRTTIDEALKIPLRLLYQLGRIRPGEYTSGFLVDHCSPRFSAYLGNDLRGHIQVGARRWNIDRKQLAQGGFQLFVIGSNGKRHLNLYLTNDNRVGTKTELGFIW